MPSEMRVKPPARSCASTRSSTVSGFASAVTSAPSARPSSPSIAARMAVRSAGGSRVGVPPPKNTVCTGPVRPASTFAASLTSPMASAAYDSREAPPPSSVAV